MNIYLTSIFNYKLIIIFFSCIVLFQQAFGKEESCSANEEVCDWKKKVVAIKTPTMVASGVMLSDKLIVTNRHVIEDSRTVLVRLPNKKIVKGYSIPNNHVADITFISLTEEVTDTKFDIKITKPKTAIMIAFDIGRNDIRIFEEKSIISYPEKSNPQARIHSFTRNLPGTSGGALVDTKGNLVGIIASGGGEYNEAVPASLLLSVYNNKEVQNSNFYQTGKAIRLCADALEEIRGFQNNPGNLLLTKIRKNCELSKNKFLLDMAGQALGKIGMIEDAIYFLEKSTSLDPKSPTSLHSLAVALHINKSYEKEILVLKKLLEYTPEDPQALRLAVQAAAYTKNKEFGEFAISLMEIHNPGAVSLAKDFLDNALN